MNKTFIFDLDDTLMWNLHDYSYPIIDFIKFTIDRIGPKAPEVQSIINLQSQKNINLVNKWIPQGKGFSKERFPTSLKETYHQICESLNIEDIAGEAIAYEIGTHAFKKERWENQGLVPGAKETLDYLKFQGDELILMTKGDLEIQEIKINTNNLESIFKERYIVPQKNKKEILAVVDNRDLSNVWKVGNSIKSDILPAIEAGIGAIYIPFETWAFEKNHNGIPDYDKLITIDEISEIPQIYSIL